MKFWILSIALLGFSLAEATCQTQYKMYCLCTPQFETLYAQYFLPSLKDPFEIIVEHVPQICPTATFQSEGWDLLMLKKLQLLERAIHENWGHIFFYSDIDIIFFKPILKNALNHLAHRDFVAQQGWPSPTLCAGFFVMRANEQTLELIRQATFLLKEHLCVDDQIAIQQALSAFPEGWISWGLLPSTGYPNGRRLLVHPEGLYMEESEIILPDDMLLFHANCTIGLKNKVHFLQSVQRLSQEVKSCLP